MELVVLVVLRESPLLLLSVLPVLSVLPLLLLSELAALVTTAAASGEFVAELLSCVVVAAVLAPALGTIVHCFPLIVVRTAPVGSGPGARADTMSN